MSICLIAPDPRTPYGHPIIQEPIMSEPCTPYAHLRPFGGAQDRHEPAPQPIRCARCGSPLDDYDAPGGWHLGAWPTPGGWCCEHCREEAAYAQDANADPGRSGAPAAMPQAADLAGGPVLSPAEGPSAIQEEAETWIEELPEDEAAGLRQIQALVAIATRGLVTEEAAHWLAEETLWQVASLIAKTGRVTLPEIGTLEAVDTQAGTALLATASPVLGANRHWERGRLAPDAREVTP